MEVLFFQIIGVCLASWLLICTWRALNLLWLKPKKLEKCLRQQGLKGNSYRFLYGDFKEMESTLGEANSKPICLEDDTKQRVIPFYLNTIKKYGIECFSWNGPSPDVLVTDPELIKEVFNKNNIYIKPEHPNPLTKLLAQGLASVEGEDWAKRRKIINPAFHSDKLKLMVPAFYLSCDEVVKKWEKTVMSSNGTCELDVWPYLQTITSDAISRTAFGSRYEEGRKIFELQREQVKYVVKALRSIYIPGSRYLPTKRNRRMQQIEKELQSSIRSLIDKRLKAMKAAEAQDEDLLGMLLESNFHEVKLHGSKTVGLTIDDVVEECKLFYFAGQETTSTLLVWTLILLCKHSEWQARAREEVLQVFGNKSPYFDGLNHLKIINMILYEVLRLYPPVAVLSRLVNEDTTLGKLRLPAGVHLSAPTILLHHDTKIWGDDAMDFNPGRFSEGLSKALKGQGLFFSIWMGTSDMYWPNICDD
uniref:Cytochrome P450 n=1 Tax=Scoparia dulcis TaxID=107240 RepID=A0A1W7HBR2_SCODU